MLVADTKDHSINHVPLLLWETTTQNLQKQLKPGFVDVFLHVVFHHEGGIVLRGGSSVFVVHVHVLHALVWHRFVLLLVGHVLGSVVSVTVSLHVFGFMGNQAIIIVVVVTLVIGQFLILLEDLHLSLEVLLLQRHTALRSRLSQGLSSGVGWHTDGGGRSQ